MPLAYSLSYLHYNPSQPYTGVPCPHFHSQLSLQSCPSQNTAWCKGSGQPHSRAAAVLGNHPMIMAPPNKLVSLLQLGGTTPIASLGLSSGPLPHGAKPQPPSKTPSIPEFPLQLRLNLTNGFSYAWPQLLSRIPSNPEALMPPLPVMQGDSYIVSSSVAGWRCSLGSLWITVSDAGLLSTTAYFSTPAHQHRLSH